MVRAMDTPLITIIILNWNSLDITLECIKSVFGLNYHNFNVVVVDNGSSDDSAAIIRSRYPQTIVLENSENLGFTGGNNTGIRHALHLDADYVWLLNNDTVVESDTLSRIVATAESDSTIGMVSPVMYFYEEPSIIQNCGCYIDWKDQKLINTTSPVESEFWQMQMPDRIWLWGTALLIKKTVINDIGLLDNNLFAYWEDTDFSVRVLRAGYRNVVDLSAKIFHRTPVPKFGVIRRSPHYFYYMARNEYYFWMKYLRGINKLNFLRNYIGNVIFQAAPSLQINNSECAVACFSGARDAVCGVTGRWIKDTATPRWLKVAMTLFSWHPHFWSVLVKGDLSGVLRDIIKKVGTIQKPDA